MIKKSIDLSFKKTFISTEVESIIFIHGIGSCKDTWNEVIPYFSQKYNTFSIDLRGHGQSIYDGPIYSMDAIMNDLEEFVNKNTISDINLIGHSLGARISIGYASKYPDKIRKVVLEDLDMVPRPAISKESSQIEKMQKIRRIFDNQQEARNLLLQWYPEEKVNFILETESSRFFKMENSEQYYLGLSPYIEYLLHNRMTLFDAEQAFKKFSTQQIPCLLFRSDKISEVSDEGAEWMKNTMPSLDIQMIRDSDHSIHRRQLKAFVEHTQNFLQH